MLDFQTASGHFLNFCRLRNLSSRTIAIYQKVLAAFSSYPSTPRGVSDFLSDLKVKGDGKRGRGLSASSLSIYYRSLKTFFRFCVQSEFLLSDPTDKIPHPRPREKMLEVLSIEDMLKILQTISRHREAKRDKAIFLLMLDTAIRPGELCSIRLKDVNFSSSLIKVQGKTGGRILPFLPETKKALLTYLKFRRPGGEAFFVSYYGQPLNPDSLRKLFRRLTKETGIKIYPYLLRHTSATFYIRNGADLESVRKLLGHTTYSTTKRYLSLNIRDLARIQDSFSPVRGLRR